jgi:hypothetical protein
MFDLYIVTYWSDLLSEETGSFKSGDMLYRTLPDTCSSTMVSSHNQMLLDARRWLVVWSVTSGLVQYWMMLDHRINQNKNYPTNI